MLLRLDPPCPRSRISLTALIDVVFILLLFFMLTTQFTRWRSLDVPMAQETAEPVAAAHRVGCRGLVEPW